MPTRPVSDIIEEWRAAERELAQCTTASDRVELAQRVARLQEEHRTAIDGLDVEAHEIGRAHV